MRLRAGAPLPLLVRKLRDAGWGDGLRHDSLRGVRVTLLALGDMLTPTTGAGRATARQIAHRTGYTERWTRYCLGVLEELELLEWSRGGIVEGKPVPSLFRVSKALLVELIALAREQGAVRVASERRATRERIARWGLFRSKRGRRSATSAHAEVSTALPPIGDVSRRAGPPGPGSRPADRPADQSAKDYYVAKIRAEMAAARGSRSQANGEKTHRQGRGVESRPLVGAGSE